MGRGWQSRFSGRSTSAIQLHQQFPSSGGRAGRPGGTRERRAGTGSEQDQAQARRTRRLQGRSGRTAAAAPGTTQLLFMEAKAGRAVRLSESSLGPARGAAH